MRTPLLLVVSLLVVLTGCNTASNMSREVGSWFRTDRATGGYNAGGQQNGSTETPAAAPATAVTSEPLASSVQQGSLDGTLSNNNVPPQSMTGKASNARAVKVALLLPLSGKNASMGKSFQDAAQMAVNDLSADNFELIPRDSGATPTEAVRAATMAMEEGAQVIIGPVFSESAAEVKTFINNRVPVLALTNDANVAGNGTYVLGFSPAQQVQRALQYASAKGIRSIAILAPSSIYGDMAVAAANNSGISIVETQRYTNTKDSIKKAVAAISARRSEIQGILLPDGGAALGNVAAELTAVALSSHDIPIIGTGLWDEQNVQQYNVLVGGFFATSDPAQRSKFTSRYQKAYGSKPVRLASLAYDATALVAVLAKQGLNYDEQALTNPSGFAGLDGIFRLTHEGIAERGLAVLEVTATGSKVVDPAPRKFQ
ncbi:MAG: penicillin-binding protein activator [Alphaproteobacteria bacterium]|nr:penicillin-binding protein activator [Alphaproteobacteria bacterium]